MHSFSQKNCPEGVHGTVAECNIYDNFNNYGICCNQCSSMVLINGYYYLEKDTIKRNKKNHCVIDRFRCNIYYTMVLFSIIFYLVNNYYSMKKSK